MKAAVVIFCCFAATLGSMVGTKRPLTPEDVKSAEFRGALDMATLEMNRVSNHPRFHAVSSFLEGTKQLVAGVLYEFSIVLRATSCENHEAHNLENLAKCAPLNLLGVSEFHCSFKVLYRPWMTEAEYRLVSEPVCMSPRESPVPFVGEKMPLTPEEMSSTAFHGAVSASALHFNQNSGLAKMHSLVRFDRPTKQVVAGLLYEFDGLFVETVCENKPENHGKGIEECALGNSARTFTCHYKILFKSWASPQYTVLDEMDCKARV